MQEAIITGASSGLGMAIYGALEYINFNTGIKLWNCHNWSKDNGIDVSDWEDVNVFASTFVKVGLLVNCAGINKINYLPNVSPEEYDEVMNTNAKSIFLCSRALLQQLRGGTIINIVSNASHVPMTSSLAYNASKAAALMITKQMARELKKTHDITVFSISPNKMFGTGMSEDIDKRVCELRGWTPEQAKAYQLAALPAGEETDPKCVAEFIAFLMSSKERHKYLNGCDIPYGA